MLGEKVLFSLEDVIFPDSESCKCDKSDIKKLDSTGCCTATGL